MPEAPIGISPIAKAYIKGNGGVVTVRLAPRHGCCGGIASLVVAETRIPDAAADYVHFKHDGVELYIVEALVGEGFRIDCEGWWKLRHLYVDGAAIRSPRRLQCRQTPRLDSGW